MKSATCSDHMEAHWQSPEILSEGWTLPNMEHHWYLPLVYYLSDYIPNSEGTRIAVPSNGLQSHVYYRKCSGLYFIRGIGGLFNKDRCREVDVVVGKCMRAISNSLSSFELVGLILRVVLQTHHILRVIKLTNTLKGVEGKRCGSGLSFLWNFCYNVLLCRAHFCPPCIGQTWNKVWVHMDHTSKKEIPMCHSLDNDYILDSCLIFVIFLASYLFHLYLQCPILFLHIPFT